MHPFTCWWYNLIRSYPFLLADPLIIAVEIQFKVMVDVMAESVNNWAAVAMAHDFDHSELIQTILARSTSSVRSSPQKGWTASSGTHGASTVLRGYDDGKCLGSNHQQTEINVECTEDLSNSPTGGPIPTTASTLWFQISFLQKRATRMLSRSKSELQSPAWSSFIFSRRLMQLNCWDILYLDLYGSACHLDTFPRPLYSKFNVAEVTVSLVFFFRKVYIASMNLSTT